jgi:hypothetical protein
VDLKSWCPPPELAADGSGQLRLPEFQISMSFIVSSEKKFGETLE